MSGSTSHSRRSILTAPNALCLFRIVGSAGLLALAWTDRHTAAFAVTVALLVSDWLDGKIAVWLEQRSPFGAQLDSVADLTMYSCVTLAVAVLYPEIVRENAAWIAAVVVSYVFAISVGLVKFRRWPSYHARSAKVSWLAAAIAIVSAFMQWSDWPVRVALGLVTLANLEAAVITLVLRRPEVDVPSVMHALKLRRTQSGSPPPE